MCRRLFVSVAVGALALAPRAAQADDAAAARALFEQASALMDAKDYARACPKLEEVLRLQPEKLGAMLALGECYEGAGKTASAWSSYLAAAERADVLRDPRGADARAKAAELRARVGTLLVVIDPSTRVVPGLELVRDGTVVASAAWDVAVPVDPGVHVVEVRAPGNAPGRVEIDVQDRQSRVARLALPSANEARAPIAPALETAPPGPVATKSTPAHAWVVGGLGVASLAGAVALGARSIAVLHQMETYCTGQPGGCGVGSPGLSQLESLSHQHNLETGFSIGLGAFAGVALTSAIVATARGRKSSASGAVVSPWVSARGFGVQITSQ